MPIDPAERRALRDQREAAVIARAERPAWEVAALAQGIRVTAPPPAPEPVRTEPLHPNQIIGRNVPTEKNREGVVFDAAPLESSAWMSLTVPGSSGYGALPKRNKKLVAYDSSPACYAFKPTTFKE
jgi:hypothetical protein